jgi:hypothetical protein
MDIKGLDIKGLDMREISHQMEKYVINHFKGLGQKLKHCSLMESHQLDFEEINHLIPQQHHHRFKDCDKFTGSCGFLGIADEPDERRYTLMLLADGTNETAYLLYVQEFTTADKGQNTLIADFLS